MKLKVTEEGLQDLRKIYAEYSSITLFDENTNERKYNSLEDLKLAKKEVIERFLLTTGFYVIIPSTYESNENLNFIIRVFIKITS